MKKTRVVITGMGVVAPNGVGLDAFSIALRNNSSGIRFNEELQKFGFGCKVSGTPEVSDAIKNEYLPEVLRLKLKNTATIYGLIAGQQAWHDAGLKPASASDEEPDWNSGCIFGTGSGGIEMIREGLYNADNGKLKLLGSRFVERTMASSISAHLGGLLGLGNQVTTNSSACTTGTESLLMSYNRIVAGDAERMLAGACDGSGPYTWGGFDSMMVLNRKANDTPEKASRPMSASANGFVPGAGAGALVLESLECAQARGARIYAEVLGGNINSGGQRGAGTMTIANPIGAQRCMEKAIENAGILPGEIDAISGHLTGTIGDSIEISSWTHALKRKGNDFPFIHALKSMTGHCLSATGAIESVAAVLQLYQDFFHASLNCEDLHPEISSLIAHEKIPQTTLSGKGFRTIAKASLGFGDVNTCIIFRKM